MGIYGQTLIIINCKTAIKLFSLQFSEFKDIVIPLPDYEELNLH